MEATQPLVSLDQIKVNLSVTLLATFYNQGLNDTQIAERTGKTQQGVSDYKLRHIEDIRPLVYDRSMYAAIDSAFLAQQARSKLKDILHTCDAFDKKDIIPLVAITDRLTTQSRLYAGESTSNVSYDDNNAGIKADIEQLKELGVDIKDMGGDDDIIDVECE